MPRARRQPARHFPHNKKPESKSSFALFSTSSEFIVTYLRVLKLIDLIHLSKSNQYESMLREIYTAIKLHILLTKSLLRSCSGPKSASVTKVTTPETVYLFMPILNRSDNPLHGDWLKQIKLLGPGIVEFFNK